MNRSRKYKAARAHLARLAALVLATVLLVVAFIAYYPDYVHAGGGVTITRGVFSPATQAAETVSAGDNDGFEGTSTGAFADGGGVATDARSGSGDNTTPTATGADKHQYYNYGIDTIPIPTGSTINGITVRADILVDSLTNSPYTAIQLSWDGGTSWTTAKSQSLTATIETTYTYGGAADNWGRTWAVSELSDANFRVRVINGDTANPNNRDFSLDWIPVSLTFTAPWDSYEDSGRLTIRETFNNSFKTAYMEGTGFATGNYNVAYYDATVSGGGNKVETDANVGEVGGVLNTVIILSDYPLSTTGLWHALVQPTGGTTFPTDYDTAVAAPETYNLIANDSFTVEAGAIPEFPTVIAAVVVAGMCFGIFYWMRKRRLAYVKV